MKYFVLLGAVLAGMVGYAGYWFYLAGQMEASIRTWQAEPPSPIVAANFSDLRIEGFPFRLKPIFTAPVLKVADRQQIWQWRKDELSFVIQPWNLTHVIGDLSGRQKITDNNARSIDLIFEDALVSLQFDNIGQLQRLDFDGNRLRAEIQPANLVGTAARVDVHARTSERPESGYDLAVRIFDANLPAQPDLPNWAVKINTIELDLSLVYPFALPLKPETLSAWRRKGGALNILTARLTNDEVKIALTGTLSVDEMLRPVGRLNVEMRGHRAIVDDLVARKKVSYDNASKARVALNFMAAAWGGKLVAPIQLKNGVATLGPLHLVRLKPVID